VSKSDKQTRIYSGIFFDDDLLGGLHMTYHFRPGSPELPKSVKDGDEGIVHIDRIVIREDFGVLGCAYKMGKNKMLCQYDSDTPLHITLYTDSKTRPVVTGEYLRDNPQAGWTQDRNIRIETKLIGKWGYFT
jgi:hypothetical protein